jgi:hypothetical protein
MLGYFRDGLLSAVGIDRPGYGVRLVSCWTGPGVIEIRDMPLPGNVGYTPQATRKSLCIELLKVARWAVSPRRARYPRMRDVLLRPQHHASSFRMDTPRIPGRHEGRSHADDAFLRVE